MEAAAPEMEVPVLHVSLDTEKEKGSKLQERLPTLEREQQDLEARVKDVPKALGAQFAAEHTSEIAPLVDAFFSGVRGKICGILPLESLRACKSDGLVYEKTVSQLHGLIGDCASEIKQQAVKDEIVSRASGEARMMLDFAMSSKLAGGACLSLPVG